MKEAKKLWSWLAIPCIALAVLTGSILPVLLVRDFYTAQIGPLGICEASGLTRQQAAEAYGDVMDYRMGRRPDFSAGVLPFSAEGAGHFADVRGLFLLVVWVFVAAAGLLLTGAVVCRLRRQRRQPPRPQRIRARRGCPSFFGKALPPRHAGSKGS